MDPSMYGGLDSATIPLAPPPPGVTPDFVHPYNRTWEIYVTSAVCLTVSTLFIALRFYAKVFLIKQTTRDDYATLVAFCAVVVYVSLTISFERTSYGIHIWDLTLTSFTDHQQLLLQVNNCLYGPVLFAVKASLFLLLYGIFGRLQWMRHLIWVGLVVTGLFYFASVVVFASLCSPHPGQSYVEVFATPRCQKAVTFSLVGGSFNILSDFYLLLLPIPAVLGLQMPTKKKIGVLAIFGTGLMACITSCLVLWTRVQLYNSDDNTWMVTPTNVTAIIEMNVGLWVGSMPALTGLIRKQSLGLGTLFNKIRYGLGSISSLLSFRASKSENDRSFQMTGSTRTLGQDLLGQPKEQYTVLPDHHERMRDARHSR